MPRPTLVIVAGAPGTGKTTLAGLLGDSLPAPVLGKDSIKEGISLTEGARGTYGGSIAQRTFAALYDCVGVLLESGCTVVAEGAFHREWFAREVARFRPTAEMRLLVCRVPHEVARARYESRAARGDVRRLAHPDTLVIEQMRTGAFPWAAYDVVDSDLPTLLVGTDEGYDPPLPDIFTFLRA